MAIAFWKQFAEEEKDLVQNVKEALCNSYLKYGYYLFVCSAVVNYDKITYFDIGMYYANSY